MNHGHDRVAMVGNEPPAEAVLVQLGRIAGSARFRGAQRLRDFLTFVATETLEGRGAELKAFTIAVCALGRSDRFDPQQDPVVRVHAQRLRQAIEAYYAVEGAQDPVIIALDKGSYAPRFSWRWAPGAVAAPLPSSLPPPAEPVHAAPSAAVVLVFPVRALDHEAATASLVRGLTEKLVAELAAHDHVAPQPVGEERADQAPAEATRALGERHYITSSVQTSGPQTRLSVQFRDAETGKTLWGGDFDCDAARAHDFEARDAIARKAMAHVGDVYGVLKTTIFGHIVARRDAPKTVFELSILYTEYKYRQPGVSARVDFDSLVQDVEAAARVHPNDPLIVAILAALYLDAHVLGFRGGGDFLAWGVLISNRAMMLSPDSIQANLVAAYAQLASHECPKSVARARRVVEIAHGSGYFVANAGWLIALAGQWEEGLALIARGTRLSPRFPPWFHAVPCLDAYRRGDWVAAFAASERFDSPDLAWSPLLRAATLGRLGRVDEGAAALRSLYELLPPFADEPWEYLHRFIPDPSLVEALMEGLELAGLA